MAFVRSSNTCFFRTLSFLELLCPIAAYLYDLNKTEPFEKARFIDNKIPRKTAYAAIVAYQLLSFIYELIELNAVGAAHAFRIEQVWIGDGKRGYIIVHGNGSIAFSTHMHIFAYKRIGKRIV